MTAHAQFPDEQSAEGAFVRQEDAFRDWVKAAPGARRTPVVPRALSPLCLAGASPWAHRTIIVRKLLLGLEDAMGMTVVDPVRDDLAGPSARVPGDSARPVNDFRS